MWRTGGIRDPGTDRAPWDACEVALASTIPLLEGADGLGPLPFGWTLDRVQETPVEQPTQWVAVFRAPLVPSAKDGTRVLALLRAVGQVVS
jgi:hypothetical protein